MQPLRHLLMLSCLQISQLVQLVPSVGDLTDHLSEGVLILWPVLLLFHQVVNLCVQLSQNSEKRFSLLLLVWRRKLE